MRRGGRVADRAVGSYSADNVLKEDSETILYSYRIVVDTTGIYIHWRGRITHDTCDTK
jgi:hypothetical protein